MGHCLGSSVCTLESLYYFNKAVKLLSSFFKKLWDFWGPPLSGVIEVNIMNRSLIDIQFKIDKLGPSSAHLQLII